MHRNPNSSHSHWRAPDGKEYLVVDMPPDMIVRIPPPTQRDIKCAVPGNPNQCALAQVWMRTEGATTAQFGVDKVFLPMPVDAELRRKIPALRGIPSGTVVALRGKIGAETRRDIDHFDRTGEFPKRAVLVGGVPPSERIDSMRAQQKRTRERWGTMGSPSKRPRRKIHVRNASRRAQVFVA